jgi:HEAT repeat protein
MMTEQPPAKPGPSRKAIIGWTVVMLAVLGLAWFVGAIVVPVWQVRSVVAYFETWGDVDEEAFKELGDHATAARKTYFYIRVSGRSESLAPYRSNAIAVLSLCERSAVPYLVELLRDPDVETRRQAACLLGNSGDPRAIEPLVERLADKDGDVSGYAAGALSTLGAAAIPRLEIALRHPDKRVRSGAALALGGIREPRSVEFLISALGDGDLTVRKSAARALGMTGSPKAGPILVDMLKGDAALSALGGLRRLGKPAVLPLCSGLKSEDRQTRVLSAHALGEIRDPGGVGPLVSALTDADPGVRTNAAEALGRIGDEHAEEPLRKALKDGNERVRKAAADALESIESARREL